MVHAFIIPTSGACFCTKMDDPCADRTGMMIHPMSCNAIPPSIVRTIFESANMRPPSWERIPRACANYRIYFMQAETPGATGMELNLNMKRMSDGFIQLARAVGKVVILYNTTPGKVGKPYEHVCSESMYTLYESINKMTGRS